MTEIRGYTLEIRTNGGLGLPGGWELSYGGTDYSGSPSWFIEFSGAPVTVRAWAPSAVRAAALFLAAVPDRVATTWRRL